MKLIQKIFFLFLIAGAIQSTFASNTKKAKKIAAKKAAKMHALSTASAQIEGQPSSAASTAVTIANAMTAATMQSSAAQDPKIMALIATIQNATAQLSSQLNAMHISKPEQNQNQKPTIQNSAAQSASVSQKTEIAQIQYPKVAREETWINCDGIPCSLLSLTNNKIALVSDIERSPNSIYSKVAIWNLSSKNGPFKLNSEKEIVTTYCRPVLTFIPGGALIINNSLIEDFKYEAISFDISTGTQTQLNYRILGVTPDGLEIQNHKDSELRLVDPNNNEVKHTLILKEPNTKIHSAKTFPDGRICFNIVGKPTIIIWDPRKNGPEAQTIIKSLYTQMQRFDVIENSVLVADVKFLSSIRKYSADNGNFQKKFDLQTASNFQTVLSPTEFCTEDKKGMYIWNTAHDHPFMIPTEGAHIRCVTQLANGDLLAVASNWSHTKLLHFKCADLEAAKKLHKENELKKAQEKAHTAAALSTDGIPTIAGSNAQHSAASNSNTAAHNPHATAAAGSKDN